MGKKIAAELKTRLQAINDEMEFYMELFNIPESVEDDGDESDYLLETDEATKKQHLKKMKDTEEDKAHRLEVKKNKVAGKHLGRKSKLGTDSNKAERKKLKKEKQLKEKLKSINMMAVKQEQQRSKLIEHKPLDVKKEKEPMFNAEGKIVFSKVQLDESDVRKKGIETDTRKLLKKAVDNKKHLAELKQSGELEKYAEIKKKQAWEKAMAKTLGQKVRDDPELLSKKLNKRKKQIKKSKESWKQRQQKIEHEQNQRQKERTANLKERAQKKKNTKLKKLAKKGRIIPGF
ncbi:surfeit locus protein 6 homolog [Anopheles funestus]|uniref:SURF6 domain-containing protein n=1 Tax=Anopheles funestus TaxID=62324 RepID=A0A182RNS0_ANOFN|nr:surfeit locus protein 6 homolog [Anopheles funestus]